jgi:hypothetical protein
MKTLLRTSILALLVFAGYSAFSTPLDQSHGNIGPVSPAPHPCPGPDGPLGTL